MELNFFSIGIHFGLPISVNDLLALENFEDADSYHIEPLVEGEAGGHINDFLFILPRYLKKEQFNSSHELVYESFCLRVGFNVGIYYRNQLVMVEEGQILNHLDLNFAHNVYPIVLLLLDVIGIVHDHLYKAR